MRTRLVIGVLLLLAPQIAGAAETAISYLAGRSVYVEAGRSEGLAVGDTLHVHREGLRVALLRVSVVSSHRAACDTLVTWSPLQIRDRVRFTPHPPDPGIPLAETDSTATDEAAALDSSEVVPAPPVRSLAPRSDRWRGRLAARWLSVSTRGTGSAYRQPALDMRLDRIGSGEGRIDLAIDMRARSTTRSRADGTTDARTYSRFYRASLTVHDRAGRGRATLGRQTARALSPVSLFDGALLEFQGSRATVGVFGGAQPEPVTLGLSREVVEGGVFVVLRQPPLAATRWSAGLGAVTSTVDGAPNRDFAFVQGDVSTRRWFGSLTQEVDLNRGWKRDLGEPTFELTSTFLRAHAEITTWSSLDFGFDNRRSVRLVLDRLTPEGSFDARFRQGAWAGITVRPERRLRISGEVRSRDGAGESSTTWTVGAEAWRVLPGQGTARTRYSHHSGRGVESTLLALALGVDPRSDVHVELSGGERTVREAWFESFERTPWVGGDLDLSLGRRWYLGISYQRDQDPLGFTQLASAALSWRF